MERTLNILTVLFQLSANSSHEILHQWNQCGMFWVNLPTILAAVILNRLEILFKLRYILVLIHLCLVIHLFECDPSRNVLIVVGKQDQVNRLIECLPLVVFGIVTNNLSQTLISHLETNLSTSFHLWSTISSPSPRPCSLLCLLTICERGQSWVFVLLFHSLVPALILLPQTAMLLLASDENITHVFVFLCVNVNLLLVLVAFASKGIALAVKIHKVWVSNNLSHLPMHAFSSVRLNLLDQKSTHYTVAV
mmetsp:Transcript_6282/g.23621  ORF Transcript_6282/g.23621 Transcript_6282/m.23621 type:complete len:250 (-) Transcript_6282:3941-4690(-)